MSVGITTSESFKEKAKIISKFMKEKHNVDVSHGHCLDLVSRLEGYNGWNVASAALKSKTGKLELPMKIKTMGDFRRATAHCKDSDFVDAGYEFKIADFLDDMEPDPHPDDEISQEFSFVLERFDDSNHEVQFVTFKLVLENMDSTIKF